MELKRCKNGHFYNAQEHSKCPYCISESETVITINQKELKDKYKIHSSLIDADNNIKYIATDKTTNKKCSIKTIENDYIWENIIKTEKIRYSIRCNNIAKLYDIFSDSNFRYVVYEYIDGVDLSSYEDYAMMRYEDIFNVAYGVAKALKYLNNIDVMHGDIKPSNIIYNKKSKRAALIDLDYLISNKISKKYNKHKFYGTITYSAPEQILENVMNSKTDIYSLGLVLYKLIENKLPFETTEKGIVDKTSNMLELEFKNISRFKNSDKLEQIIRRMLSHDPTKRININQLVNELDSIKPKDYKDLPITEENGVYKEKDFVYLTPKMLDETTNAIFYNDYESDDMISRIIEESNALFENETKINNKISNELDKHSKSTFVMSAKKQEGEEHTSISQPNSYHEMLLNEYNNLIKESKVIFRLWVSSFFFAYIILIIAIIFIYFNKNIEALCTLVLEGLIYVVQNLFKIRENHHRELIDRKLNHLERGDMYEYGFEKIDILKNEEDKRKKQNEFIDSIRNNVK